MEENAREEQFGFRKGKGTRDAIGLLKIIGERYIQRGKGKALRFIDLEKAFDRVICEEILRILKQKVLVWKERKLIRELYIRQTAALKINVDMTKWIDGVRQGCYMSQTLFNMNVEDQDSTYDTTFYNDGNDKHTTDNARQMWSLFKEICSSLKYHEA